jgi:hypothetical protein
VQGARDQAAEAPPLIVSLPYPHTETGDVNIEFGDGRLPERFWKRCVQDGSGCWQWTGSNGSADKQQRPGFAYGMIRWNNRTSRVHRVAYETLVGPIPSGLELDHLCRVRLCCNPAHLEPVTRSENVRRGVAVAVTRARQEGKAHCPKGHPYSGNNLRLRTDRPGRRCRECDGGRSAVVIDRDCCRSSSERGSKR